MSNKELLDKIKEPSNFVKNFKDLQEFREWAIEGTDKDLKDTIKEFEKAELYEYCAILQKCIEAKKLTSQMI